MKPTISETLWSVFPFILGSAMYELFFKNSATRFRLEWVGAMAYFVGCAFHFRWYFK